MLTTAPLLDAGVDPAPVEKIAATGDMPALLVCEHAGQAVPRRLNGLGLTAQTLDLHVGWDVGAAAVTRRMARRLGCAAVLQRYSRLVIDCNRPPDAADAIPAVSDGVQVPGNRDLSAAQHGGRVAEIFQPFHEAVLAARAAPLSVMLSIHSFTPRLAATGALRPWHIGFLGRRDLRSSERLMEVIAGLRPDFDLALNEPYQIDDDSDWFVPRHGEASGLPHSLIEIRHDLIATEAGQAEIADLLCDAVTTFLETGC
ncbi:N-formylglutamate amidohydrolase [Pseudooceanicola aestuarii]|uniref:N-formylglutamate amidohydrolase n=1 Tax=Pseudooceanicola aestuarii TaxID=2697319 RepID=UPI0013D19C39|nr:N-formylglutamate amidohydrolase [Pseudooceanicola aestuarii]